MSFRFAKRGFEFSFGVKRIDSRIILFIKRERVFWVFVRRSRVESERVN